MVQKPIMSRVAFALPEDELWTGGVHYLRNLLFAINTLEQQTIEPYLFAGDQVDDSVIEKFQGLARIVRNPLFNRYKLIWIVRRVINRLIKQDILCRRLFKSYKIDIASHCNISGHNWPLRTINWIPDFQHLHLPEVFTKQDIALRDLKFKQMIRRSDLMVLSSQAAFEDCKKYMPGYESKVRILHFVSQVDPAIYQLDSCKELCAKYGLPEKFYYLPNQFWKHKNHLVVFRAIDLLKKQGHQVSVVCTGRKEDYRNCNYFDEIQLFIDEKELRSNIHILGLIDYQDVQCLMRHAVSVINPSFFEGWSSTVEEAKSMGKNMILSDLPVHREQNPPDSLFFNPHSAEQLAEQMSKNWTLRPGGPDCLLEYEAKRLLSVRTKAFAITYRDIVSEAHGHIQ